MSDRRPFLSGDAMRKAMEMPEALTLRVGHVVRYRHWTGVVYKVQWNGGLLIDFSLSPHPLPFFHGPYWPHEVEYVAGSVHA